MISGGTPISGNLHLHFRIVKTHCAEPPLNLHELLTSRGPAIFRPVRTFTTCGGDGTFVCWDKENRPLRCEAEGDDKDGQVTTVYWVGLGRVSRCK